jgi:GxxExxY protein
VDDNENPAYRIVAARAVHHALGPGVLESIYSGALISELKSRAMPIQREKQIKIWYGTQLVGKHQLDLVVDGSIVVELKANRGIVGAHVAQVRSYLQASGHPYGLILNFGMPELEWELVVPANSTPAVCRVEL